MANPRTRRWKGPRRRMTLRLTPDRQADLKAVRSYLRQLLREDSGKRTLPKVDENTTISELIALGGCIARKEVKVVKLPAGSPSAPRTPKPGRTAPREEDVDREDDKAGPTLRAGLKYSAEEEFDPAYEDDVYLEDDEDYELT